MEPPTTVQSLSFLNLPPETLEEIALNLDLNSLSQLCLTNKVFSEICQDDGFWRVKYWKDINPEAVNSQGESWRDKYRTEFDFPQTSPFSTSDSNYAIIDNTGTLSLFREGPFGIYKPINPLPNKKIVSVSTASGQFTGMVTIEGEVYLSGDLTDFYPKIISQSGNLVELALPGKASQIICRDWDYSKNITVLLEDGSIYFFSQILDTGDEKEYHIQGISARKIYSGIRSLAYINFDDELYIWGQPRFFKSRLPPSEINPIDNRGNPIFQKLEFNKRIKEIHFGSRHLVILTKDGQIYQMGSNSKALLGLPRLFHAKERTYNVSLYPDDSANKVDFLETPTLFPLPKIARISGNQYGTVAVTKDKGVIIWGDLSKIVPELFQNQTFQPAKPTYFNFGKPIIDVSLSNYSDGYVSFLLLTDGGEVLYTGDSDMSPYGQGKRKKNITN